VGRWGEVVKGHATQSRASIGSLLSQFGDFNLSEHFRKTWGV
jgi:hypothetical protein